MQRGTISRLRDMFRLLANPQAVLPSTTIVSRRVAKKDLKPAKTEVVVTEEASVYAAIRRACKKDLPDVTIDGLE